MKLHSALGLPVLLALCCSAQSVTAPADARERVDQIFASFDRPTGPGCAVGVSVAGEPVLTAAYGMADLEHDVAITPETVFEPGSVTKQFTAAAVLLLAQQGKLSLDDPVRKYIPEVPDYGTPVTIRHLLNHTSGLRDWGSVEGIAGWPRTTREYTHAHVLEIIARQKSLNYPPGAEYSYTNSGYNLLAMLVERVSGKSLPAFTREQIFLPLGMTSTQWRDDFRRIVPHRAIAYSAAKGGGFRQDMPFEDVFGNGGLLTTVGDLLRWNQNFTTMKVGGREFVDRQHERGRLTDGRTLAYAAGLMVLHWRGLHEVSHSGSTAGYSAWLGRYPDQKLSVAVLCNLAAVNATRLGRQVADVYLPGEGKEAVTAQTPVPGLYRSVRDHLTMTIPRPEPAGEGRGTDGWPRFQFEGSRMRVLTEGDEGNWYERVEPWNPAAAELARFVGEYTSDEAEATFRVVLEDGRLVMHRRPDGVFPLTPTYRDGFSCALGSVRFLGEEMSLGESRVWDLRFRKVK